MNDLEDSLGAHPCAEHAREGVAQFAVCLLGQKFERANRPKLVDTLDRLAADRVDFRVSTIIDALALLVSNIGALVVGSPGHVARVLATAQKPLVLVLKMLLGYLLQVDYAGIGDSSALPYYGLLDAVQVDVFLGRLADV